MRWLFRLASVVVATSIAITPTLLKTDATTASAQTATPAPAATATPTPTPTPTPSTKSVAVIHPTLAAGSADPDQASVGPDKSLTAGASAKERAADLLETNLKNALKLSGYNVVEPSFLTPPQFTIIPTLRYGAVDKAGKSNQLTIVTLLVRGRDLSQIGSERTYDLTGQLPLSDTSLTISQISDAIQAPVPARRAHVVVVNEGTRDLQTAGTSFSGPAFTEARFIAQLLELNVRSVTAAEFLGAPSSSTGTVAATVDDLAKQICGVDPSVTLLRYNVVYDQSTNPLFSTQNATSTVYARAQPCGVSESKWPAYRQTSLTRTFGNAGKLIPIYFGFANFLLSSGRNNKFYRGILGKEGPIATSLLPDVAPTSAEAIAVGYAADRVACQYVLDQLQAHYDAPTFRLAVSNATANRKQHPFAHKGSTEDDFRGDPCHAARDIEYQLRFLTSPVPAATPTVTPSPLPSNLLKQFSS